MISRFTLTSIVFLFIVGPAFSADTAPKVLRQISIEGGYQYTTKTTFESVGKQGGSVLLSMGWRMNHLDGSKPATYLAIPFGYYGIPVFGKSGKLYSGALFYGWTIKHEFAYVNKFTPFFEYGLLLNQLYISSMVGRSIAHQTLLCAGTDITLSPDWSLLFKLEYGMSNYPVLGVKKADKINTFAVKTGLRWGGKPKTAK